MLLNDKYLLELSKVLNARLKSIQAPFFVVCNASNSRNRINETWRRIAARTCDTDYKNARWTSEREVDNWLRDNRNTNLKKLRTGNLKTAKVPKRPVSVEKPKPKAKPVPKPKPRPKAKPVPVAKPKPKAKPVPKPKPKPKPKPVPKPKAKAEPKPKAKPKKEYLPAGEIVRILSDGVYKLRKGVWGINILESTGEGENFKTLKFYDELDARRELLKLDSIIYDRKVKNGVDKIKGKIPENFPIWHYMKLLLPYSADDAYRIAMDNTVYFDEYGATSTDSYVMAHIRIKPNPVRGIFGKGGMRIDDPDIKFPPYADVLPKKAKKMGELTALNYEKLNFASKIAKATEVFDASVNTHKVEIPTIVGKSFFVDIKTLTQGFEFWKNFNNDHLVFYFKDRPSDEIAVPIILLPKEYKKFNSLFDLTAFFLLMPLRVYQDNEVILNTKLINEFYDKFHNDIFKIVPDNPFIYSTLFVFNENNDRELIWEKGKVIANLNKRTELIMVSEYDKEKKLTTDWKYPFTKSFRAFKDSNNDDFFDMEEGNISDKYPIRKFDFAKLNRGKTTNDRWVDLNSLQFEKFDIYDALRLFKKFGDKDVAIGILKSGSKNYMTIKGKNKIVYISGKEVGESRNRGSRFTSYLK